ncbi:uncharacterized protein LOC120075447 [Benincasa hispida]|uniref:uncharacterized protein LOC120075447 n=1 Tax=Benincasa hispida TaxID=102211 RepID=UPI001901E841|nr:uncharacterized protein LOC120075447 [Benincasa hispida]
MLKSQASSIRNLEIQVGQIASELKSRQPDVLPSNIETDGNNNGKEQCHAVTLRNGRALAERKMNPRNNSPSKKHITCSTDQKERMPENTSLSKTNTSNVGKQKAQPTSVTLQLADRIIKYPEGKIEDVLVKVDNHIFSVDFIILDYEADREVPIILGRPFLVTEKVLIDVHKDELIMHVDNEEVKFNVLNRLKFPDSDGCQLNNIELTE